MNTTARIASFGAMTALIAATAACSAGGGTSATPPLGSGGRGALTGAVGIIGGTPAPAPMPKPPALDLGALCAYGVAAPDLRLDNGPEYVLGNIALTAFPPGDRAGDQGRARVDDGSTVTGSLSILNAGVEVEVKDGSSVAGGVSADPTRLASVLAAELERSAHFGALPATLDARPFNAALASAQAGGTAGTIHIALKPGLNVLSVGDLMLRSHDIEVDGPADAALVINASGRVELEDVNLLVAGGIDAGQVLLNATGTDSSNDVRIKGDEDKGAQPHFNGSLLAAHSRVRVEHAIVAGILGSGDEMELRDETSALGHCTAAATTAR